MSNPQLNVLDAGLIQTVALPATATSVLTGTLDVGPKTAHGSFVLTPMELELVYPTLNGTQLPASATVTYDLLQSPNADGSSAVTLQSAVVTQTGTAVTGGAAGGSFRFAIPSGALHGSVRPNPRHDRQQPRKLHGGQHDAASPVLTKKRGVRS